MPAFTQVKTLAKPTHCSYRGCMKPLCKLPKKSERDQKWYCDESCDDRAAKFGCVTK